MNETTGPGYPGLTCPRGAFVVGINAAGDVEGCMTLDGHAVPFETIPRQWPDLMIGGVLLLGLLVLGGAWAVGRKYV